MQWIIIYLLMQYAKLMPLALIHMLGYMLCTLHPIYVVTAMNDCHGILVICSTAVDGIKFSPSYLQSVASVANLETHEILQYFNSSLIWNCWILNLLRLQGVNIKELCVRVALAGTCCSFYQQVRPVFTRKHFCGLSAVAKIVCCLLPRLAT